MGHILFKLSLACAFLSAMPLQGITWDPPVNISENGEVGEPQVVVDTKGNATAVWYNADTGFVRSSTKPAGGNWSTPITVSSPLDPFPHDNIVPQIAVDESGNVTAAWLNGNSSAIQSNIKQFGQNSWSSPQTLSGSGTIENVGLAVGPSGNATIIWYNPSTGFIRANSKAADVDWDTATAVTISDTGAPFPGTDPAPQIATDAAGDMFVVWVDQDNGLVQSNILPFGGSWAVTPTDIAGPVADVLEQPQIAVDSAGNATAVWVQLSGVTGFINSSSLPFGGSWSSPTSVSGATPYLVQEPQLAVDSTGDVTAVWTNVTTNFIQSNTLPFGGSWSISPQNVSNNTTAFVGQPQVAVDEAGSAVAIWTTADPTGFIQASVKLSGGSWSSPTNISGPAEDDVSQPQVGIDASGEAVVVWTNATTGFIQSTSTGVVITRLNPSYGKPAGGNTVNIIGQGFENVTDVTFDGVSVSFIVNSPTSITVTAPPGIEGEKVRVTVVTSFGSSPPNPASLYLYETLLPPSNFKGQKVTDVFVTQKVVGNQLTWVKSPSQAVVAYQIYRGSTLIARVSQSASPIYVDSNQTKQAQTYTIFAVDTFGNKSKGITIEVPSS